MAVTVLNKDNFEEEVTNSDIPVIIDFYADWCMPCKAMSPIFQELSSEYDGKLKFAKADTQKEEEMSKFFHISSIPSFALVHNREIKGKLIGSMDKGDLRDRINKMLEKIK